MKTKAELLQGKITNSLLESEEVEFERLLSEDQTFAKDYRMALHLSRYLMEDRVFQFRDNLQQIGNEFKSHPKQGKILHLQHYWKQIASVAAVIVVFLGGYWYFDQMTMKDKLFDQYYQIDEVYLNTRSGNSSPADVLEQGLLLFENDKYQESIGYFEQLPTSITAIYYSGVAHLEIGEYEVAKYKFDQVIDDYVNVFYDQALWYKGLCLLKQDKKAEARLVFNTISKSESYYKNQAQELSDKLK